MELSKLVEDLKSNVICWYPSSGLDLKPLYFFGNRDFVINSTSDLANEQVEFERIPQIYIYSDNAYSRDNWPLNDLGELVETDGVSYALEMLEDIFYDYEIIGKYLEIRVHSEGVKKLQKILYLFKDNANLLSEFFIPNKIPIEFIINIRDGYSENGGAEYSMKFIEFLLGYLKCEFLITDNFGRVGYVQKSIRANRLIMNTIDSKENKAVSLQGLKEWRWSEFGVFLGDAFLIKVHRAF